MIAGNATKVRATSRCITVVMNRTIITWVIVRIIVARIPAMMVMTIPVTRTPIRIIPTIRIEPRIPISPIIIWRIIRVIPIPT